MATNLMMYLASILIMGSIATVLGVILVVLDHYLADYVERSIKINEGTNFSVVGGEPLSSYTGIYPLTYDTKETRLKLEEPATISFKPGQYAQICVPGTSEYRACSMASPPTRNDTTKLVITLVPSGFCSTYTYSPRRWEMRFPSGGHTASPFCRRIRAKKLGLDHFS